MTDDFLMTLKVKQNLHHAFKDSLLQPFQSLVSKIYKILSQCIKIYLLYVGYPLYSVYVLETFDCRPRLPEEKLQMQYIMIATTTSFIISQSCRIYRRCYIISRLQHHKYHIHDMQYMVKDHGLFGFFFKVGKLLTLDNPTVAIWVYFLAFTTWLEWITSNF